MAFFFFFYICIQKFFRKECSADLYTVTVCFRQKIARNLALRGSDFSIFPKYFLRASEKKTCRKQNIKTVKNAFSSKYVNVCCRNLLNSQTIHRIAFRTYSNLCPNKIHLRATFKRHLTNSRHFLCGWFFVNEIQFFIPMRVCFDTFHISAARAFFNIYACILYWLSSYESKTIYRVRQWNRTNWGGDKSSRVGCGDDGL